MTTAHPLYPTGVRADLMGRLESNTVDLVVLVEAPQVWVWPLDAAARASSVALVESHDFMEGNSSRY